MCDSSTRSAIYWQSLNLGNIVAFMISIGLTEYVVRQFCPYGLAALKKKAAQSGQPH